VRAFAAAAAAVLISLALTAGSASSATLPGRILFERMVGQYGTDLYAIRPDGSELRRLGPSGSFPAGPSWAPDGRRLVSSVWNAIDIRSADGQVLRRIVTPGGATDLHWSPDGSRIAYLVTKCDTLHEGDACADLWVVGTNPRTAPRRLVDEGVDMTPIGRPYSWAPDGGRLVYRGFYGLIVLNVASGDRHFLSHSHGVAADDPSWSPDGRWIAFTRTDPSHEASDLWAEAPDGKGLHQISRGIDVIGSTWSPDGNSIAYLALLGDAADNEYIAVSLANGSYRRRIGTTTADGPLIWSPDSTRLVVSDPIADEVIIYRADGRGGPIRLTPGDDPDWR
jgi:Tol biopolymer transport system component